MLDKIAKYNDIKHSLNLNIDIHKNSVNKDLFFVDTDSENTNLTLKINVEKNQSVNIYIYSINNSFKKNIDIILNHSQNTISNVYIKALTSNGANTLINIISQVDKLSQNVKTNQVIDGVVFDNTSMINTTPSMIIDTNNIKGSHTVNIGKINQEQIFYLMSRGIKKNNAIAIILNGMFSALAIDKDRLPQKLYNNIITILNKMVPR